MLLRPLLLKLPAICIFSILSHTFAPANADILVLWSSGVLMKKGFRSIFVKQGKRQPVLRIIQRFLLYIITGWYHVLKTHVKMYNVVTCTHSPSAYVSSIRGCNNSFIEHPSVVDSKDYIIKCFLRNEGAKKQIYIHNSSNHCTFLACHMSSPGVSRSILRTRGHDVW